uniref:lipopolysaccharide biosynthesis protein n=1 Tax=Fusobacterium mortiferum TaxID=850 RepID=UPI003FEE4B1B
MENNLVNAFIWKFLERIGTQGVQFLLQLFLARLLIPKDYGIVALVTIFIAVSNVFIQSGFNIALIQKKKIDNIDLSSTFYISFFIATILYIILWLISPFVSNFYKIPELVMVIRIMSLTLFLGALNSIQNAIIMRELAFKKLFFSSLIAIIVSGSSGIILAYKGVGIWALIFQQLLNQLLISVILLFILEWKPKLVFSLKRVKKLFSFGGKLLCSALIDTIYKELVNIIVGKIYSPIMLGYYNRGEQFPKVLVNNFNGTIQSVIFPTLASVQQDKMKVKEIMRKGIMISSYIIFPAMVGLMAISEPLIRLVLTEKWLPCVPYLRIFCLSYALWPIHTANLQAINAIGRSDIFLKLEIIKKFIGISIILITL